jgi:hypothetical protein
MCDRVRYAYVVHNVHHFFLENYKCQTNIKCHELRCESRRWYLSQSLLGCDAVRWYDNTEDLDLNHEFYFNGELLGLYKVQTTITVEQKYSIYESKSRSIPKCLFSRYWWHHWMRPQQARTLLDFTLAFVTGVNLAVPPTVWTKEEQRALIRFLWVEGVRGAETHRRLSVLYGDIAKRLWVNWSDMFEGAVQVPLTKNNQGACPQWQPKGTWNNSARWLPTK